MADNRTLAAVFALNDKYTAAIRKIIQSQEDYEKKQKQIDAATQTFEKRLSAIPKSADSASSGIGKLAAKIGTLVSVTYLAKKGLDAMFASINLSSMQKMQETTFGALVNNQAAGAAVYQYVAAYARQSALGREDVAKGMTTFLTYSRDMNQLERMVKMTERLYAKDPTQGTEGAVFALKEVLSGDVISMRSRFGISGFNAESIRNKMGSGDVAGALDEIDAVMNRFGATQAVVDANFKSMTVQANMFKTNLQSAFGEQTAPIMERFAEMWARINANFEAGKYQPFITMLVNGFDRVGTLAIWAADNINTLIPVISGLTAAVLTYNAAQAVANVLIATGAVASVAAAMPFILITAAIAGLAVALGVANGGMDSLISKVKSVASLDDFKNQAGMHLGKLPVEISNTDPISVKGSVAIEEENLKYLIDFAGMKFFAQYSHVTPQLVMNNPSISERLDLRQAYDEFGNWIASDYASRPEGAY